MIDVEKVKLMTKISIYENGKGKEDFRVNRATASTYVTLKTIENFIYCTIVYCLGVFLYAIQWIPNLTTLGLQFYKVKGLQILIGYGIFMAVVWVASYLFYRTKYKAAVGRIQQFEEEIGTLEQHHSEEEKKDSTV